MEAAELWRALLAYGLDEQEAQLFYHLSRLQKARAAEVAHAAGRARPDAYRVLDRLVRKGFVERTLERPSSYVPRPLADALASVVHEERRRLETLEKERHAVASAWPKARSDLDRRGSRIAVHQGLLQGLGALERMVANAREEILLVMTPRLLQRLHPLDDAISARVKDGVQVRVLTTLQERSDVDALGSLVGTAQVRHLALPSHLEAMFVDGGQAGLFVSGGRVASTQATDETLLSLDAPDYVLAQKALFDMLWTLGTSEAPRLVELQGGQAAPFVSVLRGRWVRLNEARSMVLRARSSIEAALGPIEADRWVQTGLGRLLAQRQSEGLRVDVRVQASAIPDGLPGAFPSPPSLGPAFLLVDGVQLLSVYGSEDEPGKTTWTEEWGVLTNQKEAVVAAAARLGPAHPRPPPVDLHVRHP